MVLKRQFGNYEGRGFNSQGHGQLAKAYQLMVHCWGSSSLIWTWTFVSEYQSHLPLSVSSRHVVSCRCWIGPWLYKYLYWISSFWTWCITKYCFSVWSYWLEIMCKSVLLMCVVCRRTPSQGLGNRCDCWCICRHMLHHYLRNCHRCHEQVITCQ